MKSKSDDPANTKPAPDPTKKPRGGVQPKHHAPKGKAATAIRRKKIVKAILNGKTSTQAGIDSGLSAKSAPAQVTAIMKEPETQNALLAAMKKLGLDDEAIAQEHQALIKGKRYLPRRGDLPPVNPAAPDAVPGYIAVDDLQAKAKGVEMYHKLTGRYVDKHEHEIKQPVTVVIRKFCSRTPKDEGATG